MCAAIVFAIVLLLSGGCCGFANDLWRVLRRYDDAVNLVYIFIMATKIAALSERFRAQLALVWSLGCVFAEVVPQIAALVEHRFAAGVLATEEQLYSALVIAAHLVNLMPLLRNALKVLNIGARDYIWNRYIGRV